MTPVDCEDFFQCCAELVTDGRGLGLAHLGQTYQLTGPTAFNVKEICRLFGNMFGKDCKFKPCGIQDFKSWLEKCPTFKGLEKPNAWQAMLMAEICSQAESGIFSMPSNDVAALCGGEGGDFLQTLQEFQ